jgi:hypothetical protein
MRCLARQHIAAGRVAVERRAPAGEVLDPRGRFGSHRLRDLVIDDAGAGLFGIERMGVRPVTRPDGGGYTSLSPGR